MHFGFGEWLAVAGLVVGAVALLTLPQMFWGRPSLDIRPANLRTGDIATLHYEVFNRPVHRGLVWIGVRREVARIAAGLQITRADTGEVVLARTTARDVETHDKVRDVDLSASTFIPRRVFVLGGWPTSAVITQKEGRDDFMVVGPGTYSAELAVHVGEKCFVKTAAFVVTSKPSDSYWVHQ